MAKSNKLFRNAVKAKNTATLGSIATAAADIVAVAAPAPVASVAVPTKIEFDAVVTAVNELRTLAGTQRTLINELKLDLNATLTALKS